MWAILLLPFFISILVSGAHKYASNYDLVCTRLGVWIYLYTWLELEKKEVPWLSFFKDFTLLSLFSSCVYNFIIDCRNIFLFIHKLFACLILHSENVPWLKICELSDWSICNESHLSFLPDATWKKSWRGFQETIYRLKRFSRTHFLFAFPTSHFWRSEKALVLMHFCVWRYQI